MKKYSWLILFVLIFTLGLSGCGKKANPIELPPTDNISSIEIAGGIKDTIITDKEMIASFIQKVVEATPTSKQSVQDVPTVSEYTRVDFVSDGNISSIFIYQENSKW
ncbi:MAG: DUF5301 domain-containing protein, partial [Eubacteriales bacterium]|nr:DUF5301 domain-containing protein [Eubacteriales bacterium]